MLPMSLALVSFLAAVLLWILGTLPWVVLNAFFCSLEASIACPDPATTQTYILQILAVDLILIIMAGFAVAQLRHQPRPRFGSRRSKRRRSKRRPQ